MLGLPLLVVEDNTDDLDLVRRGLRSLPFELRHARSLASARVAMLTQAVSAVLLDLSLPDSRGLATVHAMAPLSDAIVVLTGDDELDPSEVIRAGADDMVSKNAGARELRRAVLCTIERAQRKRNRAPSVSADRALVEELKTRLVHERAEVERLRAELAHVRERFAEYADPELL